MVKNVKFNRFLQDNHVEKTKKIIYIWKIFLSCQFQNLKINYNVILFNYLEVASKYGETTSILAKKDS